MMSFDISKDKSFEIEEEVHTYITHDISGHCNFRMDILSKTEL